MLPGKMSTIKIIFIEGTAMSVPFDLYRSAYKWVTRFNYENFQVRIFFVPGCHIPCSSLMA